MPLPSGQPVPWFTAPSPSNREFVFDSAAGRYVLLLFLPQDAEARVAALRFLSERQRMFDDTRATALVILRRPDDVAGVRDVQGLRWLADRSGMISDRFGPEPNWTLLDPTLRVIETASIEAPEPLFSRLAALPPPGDHAGVPLHAPVLIAPRIFEPEFCRALLDLFQADGGQFTGVMRDAGDRTEAVMDELKTRRDILVRDPELETAIRQRLERRLFPMIATAFSFQVSRIERYLLACYDAADRARFAPHRDSTTLATAHRRFACSINLNDEFQGGDLRFPEYGPTSYRPPLGGAVVFSCAMQHEAMPVTSGVRYAFLPFFFDEKAQATLDAYNTRVARGVSA
jgi:predicted 2-oxoglutarate/Fe(II)-dependent dioxygenase YbiX